MNNGEECAGMARRRRSPRLHPQILASEEGAGVTARRRSPRLHPQILSSEEGAGVTARRRSPRLNPQIQAGQIVAGLPHRRIRRRRRGVSPAGTSSMPDDDNMLREIFLRLPPQPSSLPRASAVCKRWLAIVTDSKFQGQFRAHHREPPLLGAFVCSDEEIVFTPVLDPPDRIPPQRFDLGRYSGSGPRDLLDCRYGRVLIKNRARQEITVCNPITGEAIPPDFNFAFLNGAVLCAAGDIGHVHGGCNASPFKVVLMSMRRKDRRHVACVYSSETGTWGNLISTDAPWAIPGKPAALVGNCLYWLSMRDVILEFELDQNNLSVIRVPFATDDTPFVKRQIIQAEDGAVGYAILSYPRLQTWQRNVNGHGVTTWVPWKTIEMDTILGLPSQVEGEMEGKEIIRGYEEDTDVMFLRVNGSVYLVQLKSMQCKKLCGYLKGRYHPFRSFCTPAIRECDKADMLHNP